MFEDQLKLFDAQLDELRLNLSEKMMELDDGKANILELHQEIEKLEADVADKTKVSWLIMTFKFIKDVLFYSGDKNIKSATLRCEENAPRRN